MNLLDVCPDNLLARATTGPLPAAERSQLAAHLARCANCRAAADVAGALAAEPSAVPGDEILIARLASRAVAQARPGRSDGHPGRVPLPSRDDSAGHSPAPSRRRRARPLARAAAAVLFAGSAFAGIWHFAAPRRAPPRPASVERPAAPAATEDAKPVPSSTAEPPAPPPPKPARRFATATDIQRLLADARRSRTAGDADRARTLYARVSRLAPGTPAAAVALMGIGLILVERPGLEDARAALEAFDRYLAVAPAGALREEAVVGRARALESLGERERAAAAWQDLLDHYPRSVRVPLARQRLDALAGSRDQR